MEHDKELSEKLLRMVKREVKQIMEEAVTKKFIHEDSSSITSLCGRIIFFLIVNLFFLFIYHHFIISCRRCMPVTRIKTKSFRII